MSDLFKEQAVVYIKYSMCTHGHTVSGLSKYLETGWRVANVTGNGTNGWLVVIVR
jgi:hypothetical protein